MQVCGSCGADVEGNPVGCPSCGTPYSAMLTLPELPALPSFGGASLDSGRPECCRLGHRWQVCDATSMGDWYRRMVLRCESCGAYSDELDKDTGIAILGESSGSHDWGRSAGRDEESDADADPDDDPDDDGGDHWDDGDYD